MSTTGNPPLSWYWDFGDSTWSTATSPTHQYAVSGIYWVCLTVTDVSGCSSTFCNQVNIGGTAPCNADWSYWADTLYTAYFTDMSSTGTPPLSRSWDFGDSTFSTISSPTHTYAAPGSYWVCLTVTDSSGCSSDFCDVVNIGNVNYCSADFNYLVDTTNTVSFNDYSTGGITDWSWDFGDSTSSTQQNPTHTYAGAGTYWVCLTVWSDTNCVDTWCEPVVIDPNISCFTLSTSVINASCAGSCDGEATVIVSGGTPPFTYSWDDPANSITSTVSGLCAGTYTVLVTDSNGCFGTIPAVVGEPSIITIAITPVDASCGLADGSATAAASGGSGSYSYTWSDGQTTAVAGNLFAGSYTVTATDTNGCTASEVATISDAGGPSISVSATDVSGCAGFDNGSINITVNGGTAPYTYLWSDGSAVEDIDSLTAGTYSVDVTDSAGCIGSASATLGEPAGMSFSVETTKSNCGGSNGTAKVTVSGGASPFTYLWDGGETTDSIGGLSAGSYTVVVTDANSCVDSTTANVSDLGGSTLSAVITDVSCNGSSDGAVDMTVTGGTGSYSYIWFNGSFTEDIAGLTAGAYMVVVTDAGNGCQSANTFIVDEPDVLTVSVTGSDVTGCGNADGDATPSVTGGTSPYSYAWSNGDTTETATGLSDAGYGLTVTDANGCTASDSVTIGIAVPVQEICLVTIDPASSKYVVVWEKSGLPVDSFRIYREIAITDSFEVIGRVAYGDSSIFVDAVSFPATKSELYKIAAVDSCGNESVLSALHHTLHLTVSLGPGVINLVWDNYIGFSGVKYRIWRGTSPLNMAILDSISGSSITYTDTMPPVGDSIYYQLELIHPTGCNPTLAKVLTYNSARSNVSNRMTTTGIDEFKVQSLKFKVYPNPYNGQTEITYTLAEKANVMLDVYNILGKKVKTLVNITQNAGKYQYRFSGYENGNSPGIFILKLVVNEVVYTKRLVELK
ncbi:MAG: PKD domain-containing protein [Cytophagales bacterium]|nr:PKD domain-containing protein [Cytophagales bacterium]